ncbi:hypothetical protein GGR52DRAFT_18802 [Hypoxylon sp. FL1284]|nr:hypothetical protein GGR52DRAFT_18802 [Hypoxylon sp. FL1284]
MGPSACRSRFLPAERDRMPTRHLGFPLFFSRADSAPHPGLRERGEEGISNPSVLPSAAANTSHCQRSIRSILYAAPYWSGAKGAKDSSECVIACNPPSHGRAENVASISPALQPHQTLRHSNVPSDISSRTPSPALFYVLATFDGHNVRRMQRTTRGSLLAETGTTKENLRPHTTPACQTYSCLSQSAIFLSPPRRAALIFKTYCVELQEQDAASDPPGRNSDSQMPREPAARVVNVLAGKACLLRFSDRAFVAKMPRGKEYSRFGCLLTLSRTAALPPGPAIVY